MITFNATTADTYTLIHFEIEGGVCSPGDLENLQPPKVDSSKGVVLSGRGPVWLYGCLLHHYHPAAWAATRDDRHGRDGRPAAVVVMSHAKAVKSGQVILMDKDNLEKE
ncbi:MAG: CRISPR-associated protein Csx3 [Nitrospinae bacterium]|nr:CRISPR-associated protein Csx3 [Nitrospinota bacterium]